MQTVFPNPIDLLYCSVVCPPMRAFSCTPFCRRLLGYVQYSRKNVGQDRQTVGCVILLGFRCAIKLGSMILLGIRYAINLGWVIIEWFRLSCYCNAGI